MIALEKNKIDVDESPRKASNIRLISTNRPFKMSPVVSDSSSSEGEEEDEEDEEVDVEDVKMEDENTEKGSISTESPVCVALKIL